MSIFWIADADPPGGMKSWSTEGRQKLWGEYMEARWKVFLQNHKLNASSRQPTFTERPNRPISDVRFPLTEIHIRISVHLFDLFVPGVRCSIFANQSFSSDREGWWREGSK